MPQTADLPRAAALLEQTCECLTLTCALELRAALERGALLTSQQNARSLVEQVGVVQVKYPAGLRICWPQMVVP